jgi:hypothetical protein
MVVLLSKSGIVTVEAFGGMRKYRASESVLDDVFCILETKAEVLD